MVEGELSVRGELGGEIGGVRMEDEEWDDGMSDEEGEDWKEGGDVESL
jgi:hypothetical protein